jgi:predicted nucleic acid-binding protein
MLVIDASATTELLLARPAAERIAAHIADYGHDLHAPHLLDVEVLSALRRLVTTGDACDQRAEQALVDLADLPLQRYAHDILVPRIWNLRRNFSSYDAAYLALAEALTEEGVPLLTTDARFARAIGDHAGITAIMAA